MGMEKHNNEMPTLGVSWAASWLPATVTLQSWGWQNEGPFPIPTNVTFLEQKQKQKNCCNFYTCRGRGGKSISKLRTQIEGNQPSECSCRLRPRSGTLHIICHMACAENVHF